MSTSRRRGVSLIVAGSAILAAAGAARPGVANAQSERYRDLVFDDVDVVRDVVYGSAIDIPSGQPVELVLDIYEPAGDTVAQRGAFLFVHGGGFVAGSRAEGRFYCELMARRGYFSVSISYRLSQGNLVTQGIPAAVSDARQAVRWLRDHSEEQRIDPERIVIAGSSAGAITGLFLTYTDVERETSGTSSDTAAVVDLWGGLFGRDDEIMAGDPPLVIIHGTEDQIVPFSQAEALRERAVEVDLPHAYHPVEGEGHAPFDPQRFMTWAADFLYDQLWAVPPQPTVSPSATPGATATATPTDDPTAPAPDPVALYLPRVLFDR